VSDRRRNLFVLLLVAGLVVASLAVIFTKKTRLGLDLKGGVQLVYQANPTPQQPKVTSDAIQRALDIMRERVDQLGVSEPTLQKAGTDQIEVDLPDVKNAKRAIDTVGTTAQLQFYDWEPNVIGPDGKPVTTPDGSITSQTQLAATGGQAAGTAGAISQYQAVKLAEKRPAHRDANNTTGDQYYLVNDTTQKVLRGPEEVRADLTSEAPAPPGSRVAVVHAGTIVVQAERPDTLPKNAPYDRYYVLQDNPALRGTDIKNPEQNFDSGAGGTGEPNVTFDFTGSGRKKWQDVTRQIARRGQASLPFVGSPEAARQHFAAVLDNKLITVPYIDFQENPAGIDGRNGSEISGGFNGSGGIQRAQDLANLLKTGALPVKLKLISQSQVSATLGKQALHQGLLAGLAGLALVAIFLITFYRVLGLIAVGALALYALYLFALIKLIPITMTLPGIAGLILTIGVAADANIVIFERIKEEIRAGRSIPAGIAAGYKKGFSTILDANVVTIMTAFILFILATAGVKGFAFTLGIGTLVSLFTAVLATQAVLGTMSRSRMIGHPRMLGVRESTRRWTFDFMGASKWFFSMSGVILLVGALAIGGKGLNFGIDFKSGTRIKTPLERPATESQVRSVMDRLGYADAEIQRVNDKALGPNVIQISTSQLQPDKVQKVRSALDTRFGVANGKFSNTSIGPTFGQSVARTAIIAIIASLLVISAYIALRFEWKYAVPVLIALMHDILITGGVYSLTGREVTTSTVAALLTILGYSLYDTIIVFDRIRENVPRMPRAAFSQIVNRSMSEVLTRSLATSLSTLMPVLALLFFGGETLKDFAFALLVGIASGAYSSVFIASPVLTHWKEREAVYERRRSRIRTEFGGIVPAYATATVGGAPVDVAPAVAAARPNRRITTPEEPEEISAAEFDELVRDLHDDEDGGAGDGQAAEEPPVPVPGRTARSNGPPRQPKPKREKPKRPRNKRHGRPR
jgi:SecD/SecF fusion protein